MPGCTAETVSLHVPLANAGMLREQARRRPRSDFEETRLMPLFADREDRPVRELVEGLSDDGGWASALDEVGGEGHTVVTGPTFDNSQPPPSEAPPSPPRALALPPIPRASVSREKGTMELCLADLEPLRMAIPLLPTQPAPPKPISIKATALYKLLIATGLLNVGLTLSYLLFGMH